DDSPSRIYFFINIFIVLVSSFNLGSGLMIRTERIGTKVRTALKLCDIFIKIFAGENAFDLSSSEIDIIQFLKNTSTVRKVTMSPEDCFADMEIFYKHDNCRFALSLPLFTVSFIKLSIETLEFAINQKIEIALCFQHQIFWTKLLLNKLLAIKHSDDSN